VESEKFQLLQEWASRGPRRKKKNREEGIEKKRIKKRRCAGEAKKKRGNIFKAGVGKRQNGQTHALWRGDFRKGQQTQRPKQKNFWFRGPHAGQAREEEHGVI